MMAPEPLLSFFLVGRANELSGTTSFLNICMILVEANMSDKILQSVLLVFGRYRPFALS